MASWSDTLGIQTQAVMGYSLGEITTSGKPWLTRLTLNASDALSFETGLQFLVQRAKVFCSDPTRSGGMTAIAISDDHVAQYISEMSLQDQVSIAVYNCRRQ
jgi:acyl transferase domain-containing protein